ncbi:MAG: hypothetical protein ACXAEU_22960 [Candidatus Hodarchaeales archaeon]|jgi:hypothetical protein
MGYRDFEISDLESDNRKKLFEIAKNATLCGINRFTGVIKPFFDYCRDHAKDLPFFPPPLRVVRDITNIKGSNEWLIEPDWRVIRDMPVPGTVLTYLEYLSGEVEPAIIVNCEDLMYFAEQPDLELHVYSMIVELDQEYHVPKIEVVATTTDGRRLRCIRYFDNNPRDIALFCLLAKSEFIYVVIVHGADSLSMIALKLPDNIHKRLENLINLWLKNPCPTELFKDVVADQLACHKNHLNGMEEGLVDYYMLTDPFDDNEIFEDVSVLESAIDDLRKRMTLNQF